MNVVLQMQYHQSLEVSCAKLHLNEIGLFIAAKNSPRGDKTRVPEAVHHMNLMNCFLHCKVVFEKLSMIMFLLCLSE